MLNKTITYRGLLRLAAIVILLLCLMNAYELFIRGSSIFEGNYPVNSPTVLFVPTESVIGLLQSPGVLPLLAAGLLTLCLSFQKPLMTYICLHFCIWLLGIFVWYSAYGHGVGAGGYENNIPSDVWPWLAFPIIGSIILLALYVPMIKFLSILLRSEPSLAR